MSTSNASSQHRTISGLLILCAVFVATTKVIAETIVLSEEQPGISARLLRTDSWPRGDVAVILHGTLSHRDTEIIQSLESLLGEEGVSTLAINLSLGIDQREQALPCDAPHRHLESDASTELARWSRWLASQAVQEITAIGHSRGANQISRYLHDSQDPLIRRLVLIAPPQWSSQKADQAYRLNHGVPLADVIARAQKQIAQGQGSSLMPHKVGLLYCRDTRATAASFLSYYSKDPLRDTPTLVAALSQPVLIIAGSDDKIAAGLPAAMTKRAPTVDVQEINGADHFFRDLYADELVEKAIDFMRNND